MEDKIKVIEGRLDKIEDKKMNILLSAIDKILLPLALVILGVLANQQIEADKREFKSLEIMHQMLPTLLSDNLLQSVATQRILEVLVTDENLSYRLKDITMSHLYGQCNKYFKKGDFEEVVKMMNELESESGKSGKAIKKRISEKCETSKASDKYNIARLYEEKGFNLLVSVIC